MPLMRPSPSAARRPTTSGSIGSGPTAPASRGLRRSWSTCPKASEPARWRGLRRPEKPRLRSGASSCPRRPGRAPGGRLRWLGRLDSPEPSSAEEDGPNVLDPHDSLSLLYAVDDGQTADAQIGDQARVRRVGGGDEARRRGPPITLLGAAPKRRG